MESEKLQSMVRGGEASAYEALQLYKGRASRFSNKNEPAAAARTCVEACALFFREGYVTAGHELAAYAVEVLSSHRCPLDFDSRGWVNAMDDAYAENHESRYGFLREAIAWSKAVGDRFYGEPSFHARAADAAWKLRRTTDALRHFALAEAPVAVCERILELPAGSAAEKTARDNVLVQAVLFFLSFENLRDANEVMRKFDAHYQQQGAVYESPQAVFLRQLLLTCERDAAALFKAICEANASFLDDEQTQAVRVSYPTWLCFLFFGLTFLFVAWLCRTAAAADWREVFQHPPPAEHDVHDPRHAWFLNAARLLSWYFRRQNWLAQVRSFILAVTDIDPHSVGASRLDLLRSG